jgi:glycosyltransferase involved in cell wall biosynthesis
MNKNPRSLIVIPTYNEAENLERLISAILALDAGFEILIVDDNSPDGTGDIADRLSTELPGIHVMHRADTTTSSRWTAISPTIRAICPHSLPRLGPRTW